MRRTKRKKTNFVISKEMIIFSVVFVVFVLIGTYLNKFFQNGQDIVLDGINILNDYYSKGSNINVKAVVFSNLKENIIYLGGIVVFSPFTFTFPIAIISFLVKGLSIGYTINSFILLMKLKSIKMILIIIMKNFIIIPGAIFLITVSFYYIRNIYEEYKRGRKEGILFLGKRYLLNGIIVIVICTISQLLLNAVSVGILQFLVK